MIWTCNCPHEGQDQLHGTQRRVMNQTKDPSIVRCTVCKREHRVKEEKKETKDANKC